jgi:hypothetical protein
LQNNGEQEGDEEKPAHEALGSTTEAPANSMVKLAEISNCLAELQFFQSQERISS